MSYQEAESPDCLPEDGLVELRIEPKEKDLGEFTVRRVLPAAKRRMVGPFIFFDHMGPAEFAPGDGIQVRPHPHIGIATITYLFAGQIMHRDSLGFVQAIRPGAVNLMTAGKGIVHSERAGDDLDEVSELHGIQSWIALPDSEEECDPAFAHYAATELPEFSIHGVRLRLIMGEAYGHASPVAAESPIIYLECHLPAGSSLKLPDDYSELAAYVVDGKLEIAGEYVEKGVMAVTRVGKGAKLHAPEDAHVMLIGGEPVGKRYIWWNLVSSSRARIEQAKEDWQEGRFAKVPGDDEFIPLPQK